MRFILIGHGYWGRVWQQILSSSKHRLENIIDPFLYNNNIQTTKIDSIDSIIIASPINTHFSYAEYSILNKKNVLIEKPGTHSLNDIRKLAAIKTNKNIGVGGVRRRAHRVQQIFKRGIMSSLYRPIYNMEVQY
tara:strand:- start:197 stop:598 length:402 start_codon:yes stop_codon:yes gene_type:complete